MSFWSDDFDMDLLQLFPDLRELPGVDLETPLWTYGSSTKDGRLAHPATWDGAFFFSSEPKYKRDQNGWISIESRVTQDALHQVSLLDVVRDQWVHSYRSYLDLYPWADPPERGLFDDIMGHRRGYNPCENIDARMRWARAWVEHALYYGEELVRRFREVAPA